jgi:parallel beta-helix repeat protein
VIITANLLITLPNWVSDSDLDASSDVIQFTATYVPHENITITSNAEFDTFGFPGDGSPSFPYVIEGYSITTEEYCISITNTTVHFVIEDCLLTDAIESGISLDNATHGTIRNNIISGIYAGIRLHQDSHNSIVNNTVFGNDYGVIFESSNDNTFTNNTVSGNSESGVDVFSSNHSLFAGNTISGNSRVGLDLSDCWNNSVVNNVISNNFGDGIYIEGSSNNVITNNTIAGNYRDGIELYYSPDNTLSGNTLMDNGVNILGYTLNMWKQNITADNTQNGKLLGYFWNRTGGVIDGTQYDQVILANCTGVTVENGTYENNPMGVELAYSSHCNLANNTIFRSREYGVYFYESSNNTVVNCTISESTVDGLMISFYSSTNMFANNTISKNGDTGMHIYAASNNNTVVNNTIFANSVDGLRCSSDIKGTLIYQNHFGYNFNRNAYDSGTDNHWNISGKGNSWSDYGGSGVYPIPGGAGSVDHHPSIYQLDSTPPTIDHPPDIKYVEGTTGHNITWTPSDENPFFYQLYQASFLVEEDYWYGGPISISIDGLSVDFYGYRILVLDIGFNWVEDVVIVTVVQELDAPTIDSPNDIEYEVGTTGHNITWTPSDVNPFYYIIYRNGTELIPAAWDGGLITVIVDGLSVGVINYTIVVFDTSGNWNHDTVFVTVVPQATTTTTTPITTTTTTSSTSTTTSTSPTGTTETTPTTTSPTSTSTTTPSDDDVIVILYFGISVALGIFTVVIVYAIRKRK